MWKSQRTRDRESFEKTIQIVTEMSKMHLNVAEAQTKLLGRLLDQFDTGSTPKARVMDDEKEIKIIQKRWDDGV